MESLLSFDSPVQGITQKKPTTFYPDSELRFFTARKILNEEGVRYYIGAHACRISEEIHAFRTYEEVVMQVTARAF